MKSLNQVVSEIDKRLLALDKAASATESVEQKNALMQEGCAITGMKMNYICKVNTLLTTGISNTDTIDANSTVKSEGSSSSNSPIVKSENRDGVNVSSPRTAALKRGKKVDKSMPTCSADAVWYARGSNAYARKFMLVVIKSVAGKDIT